MLLVVRIPASHKSLAACFLVFFTVIVRLVLASKLPQLTFRVASSTTASFR